MKPRMLVLLFLATGLLLSTLGCSKKDDPGAQSTANAGSYLSDGRRVTCSATADLYSTGGNDYLTLELTTTPQPAAGKEVLRLLYSKSTAQPASDYSISQMQQVNRGSITVLYSVDTYRLTPNSDGSFSGTFSSGTRFPTPGITAPNLTSGVFINVRP